MNSLFGNLNLLIEEGDLDVVFASFDWDEVCKYWRVMMSNEPRFQDFCAKNNIKIIHSMVEEDGDWEWKIEDLEMFGYRIVCYSSRALMELIQRENEK